LRSVFFVYVHALVIKKVVGAMGDLHSGSPLIEICGKDLT